jgi:hypothetical protein
VIARSNIYAVGLWGFAAAAFVVMMGLLGAANVAADGPRIDGGSWDFDDGSTGNVVQIEYTGIPAAGLGAADISVAFDSSVLSLTACTAGDLAGACNPNGTAGPARAAGFSAPAITTEPVVIATMTLDCVGAAGSTSALTISVNELVDGTPGNAAPISATVQNGAVTCGEAPTGPTPTPDLTWIDDEVDDVIDDLVAGGATQAEAEAIAEELRDCLTKSALAGASQAEAISQCPAAQPPTGGAADDSSAIEIGWIVILVLAVGLGAIGAGIFVVKRLGRLT